MELLFIVVGGAALIGLCIESIPLFWRKALGGLLLLLGLLSIGLGPGDL